MTDLSQIERLQAVHLEPEDIIVATVPDDFSQQDCRTIKEALKRIFRHNEITVITSTLDLSIYRRVEQP